MEIIKPSMFFKLLLLSAVSASHLNPLSTSNTEIVLPNKVQELITNEIKTLPDGALDQ